ncbi:patatin-like phospholipase family protein [Caballeronia sp. M23-90]
MNDKALLIFQGGGAKGIVHVGALLAVEQMNLGVRGVAGTSAGSIVAALVAAGFSGEDLVNLRTGKHLLENKYDDMEFSRPRDLFGKWGWKRLRWVGRLVYWGPTLILMATVAALFAVYAGYAWLGMELAILCVVLPVVFFIWMSVGITSTEDVRKFIDAVLRSRIQASTEAGVTFSDLEKAGGLPLKIVATNVSEERAEVFCLERTPDVAVADAVAASICLPVIFRPHRFLCTRGKGVTADRRERSYVDGGLISNLPVWTLDEEREKHDAARDGELLTIAFGIEPKDPGSGTLQEPSSLLQALISAVVAGSLELDMRKVPNAHHIMMPCALKLMDFHKPKHIYLETVEQAKGLAFSLLQDGLVTFPKNIASACQAIQGETLRALHSQIGVWHSNTSPLVRVTLAVQPRGSYAPPAWTFSIGFPGLPEFSPEGAWESGEPMFGAYEGGHWPGQHWRIVIPVSGRRPRPARSTPSVERGLVIAVECDVIPDLALKDVSNFQPFIDALETAVLDFCYRTGIYVAVQRSTSWPWD